MRQSKLAAIPNVPVQLVRPRLYLPNLLLVRDERVVARRYAQHKVPLTHGEDGVRVRLGHGAVGLVDDDEGALWRRMGEDGVDGFGSEGFE